MTISRTRKDLLKADIDIVKVLYKKACEQSGEDEVKKDLTRLWDLRCTWGVHRILPFGSTEFKNVEEMLYIAKELCGF